MASIICVGTREGRLWGLLAKKIPINIELANKKLEYYDMKFEKEAFIESLMNKKRIWENELKPLVGYVPDFGKTVDEIVIRSCSFGGPLRCMKAAHRAGLDPSIRGGSGAPASSNGIIGFRLLRDL